MTRRRVGVTVLVFAAALAACENKGVNSAGGGAVLPSRAAAIGEFSDNALLGFVPADTAYAFATFKAFPLDLIQRMSSAMLPMWRRFLTMNPATSNRTPEQDRIAKDILDALEHLDAKTVEDAGFSSKAKWVIYGLGAYPVMRIELASGDRAFEFVKRTATRWGKTLPPPTERAGRRYWINDDPAMSAVFAIGPKEAVFALAPRAIIDANLAVLLGEQKPAGSMTTAQFRAIAERDGFTGQGVGFVDVARVGALVATATGATPACGAAIAGLAQRVPRFAIGYDDIAAHRLAFGMVLELAPDLIAELRGLASPLAGIDKLLAAKPMMAMAVAMNIEHGRATLGRVAGALGELGQQCQSTGLISAMTSVAGAATRPLPPMLAGLRGGYVVLNHLKIGPGGQQPTEGFGAVQLDHPDELLKLAASQLPSFSVPLDGKPHALPALLPVTGHIAANETAIGVGLGANSATTSVDAIHGKPGPAPLALIQYDYSRLGELMNAAMPKGADADMMRDMMDMMKMFGMATIQLVADARGFVMWMSLDIH
jgi:hypothetical protein